MSQEEKDSTTPYKVVVNHEEQYSIWPADREIPPGWKEQGKVGPKAECLAAINELWTDMRPLSLRMRMAEAEKDRAASRGSQAPAEDKPSGSATGPTEDDLVNRLVDGKHPVEVSLRPERTALGLKEAVDRGYVFLKFTETRGGTELGVRLDPAASDWRHADFQGGKGTAHLVGRLSLNFVKVRCVADIDLAKLSGEGRLELEAV